MAVERMALARQSMLRASRLEASLFANPPATKPKPSARSCPPRPHNPHQPASRNRRPPLPHPRTP
ncbi:MAG TPA: hypothetical protein VME43_18980, partial [Bryobacteraceae bacterium]|nr:hypothetical protein [Bryobacteraceae bacterium]